MSLIRFTSNHTDHSNDQGYQFEFHCDHCHNGHMTAFQPSKLGMAGNLLRAADGLFGGIFGSVANAGDQMKDAFRGKARDDAFRAAVDEASKHFKQCSRCGKWVCPEHCWNAERSLCEGCAPNLQEEIASAQATIAKEQVWEKLRASDQLAGVNLAAPRTANCPNCGAPATSAKFCSECGHSLQPKDKCTGCGATLKPGVKFCSECGAKTT